MSSPKVNRRKNSEDVWQCQLNEAKKLARPKESGK